jgi:hypothetical protein
LSYHTRIGERGGKAPIEINHGAWRNRLLETHQGTDRKSVTAAKEASKVTILNESSRQEVVRSRQEETRQVEEEGKKGGHLSRQGVEVGTNPTIIIAD